MIQPISETLLSRAVSSFWTPSPLLHLGTFSSTLLFQLKQLMNSETFNLPHYSNVFNFQSPTISMPRISKSKCNLNILFSLMSSKTPDIAFS